MDNKFIYVFSEEDRDKLLKKGHQLLVDDTQNSIFVFASDTTIYFSLHGITDYITSDTISF